MPHVLILILLFILGLITGFIGTNTGGSVFITVPTMILLGISAQSAIASARLASVGTMIAGFRQLKRAKLIISLLFQPPYLVLMVLLIGLLVFR